jgi:hypothetical protein
MKAICEEQAFQLGFLKAENRELASELQTARVQSYKEKLYLERLVEGYRIKIGKYKQIVNDENSLSIALEDL